MGYEMFTTSLSLTKQFGTKYAKENRREIWLVMKSKSRRPLEKHAYGWKDNIKVDRKHRVEGRIKDLAGSGKRQVVGL